MPKWYHLLGAALLVSGQPGTGQSPDLEIDVPPPAPPSRDPPRVADCNMPMSWNDMRRCADYPYPKAFFELEAAWSLAMAKANKASLRAGGENTQSERESDRLGQAQGDWLRFRDRHCDRLLLEQADPARRVAWSSCMETGTRARAAELRGYRQDAVRFVHEMFGAGVRR